MQFKLGICQMQVVDDKVRNLRRAAEWVHQAAMEGAQVVMLPEMFCCPYQNDYFVRYAEPFGEGITEALREMAATEGVYLIGGSMPEAAGGKIYNTCAVFGPAGELLGKYSKMHLFDIQVTGGVAFKESDTLAAGGQPLVVDTAFGKIGVAICFDIRFPELARLLTLAGAQVICLPGAFNMTTGPAHWALSVRMRAVDNQVYFAAASPARDVNFSYVAYGHSMLADPWGNVVCEADAEEGLVYGLVDTDYVEQVRRELPLLSARRTDVYRLNGQ